jgi:hypothetical protein
MLHKKGTFRAGLKVGNIWRTKIVGKTRLNTLFKIRNYFSQSYVQLNGQPKNPTPSRIIITVKNIRHQYLTWKILSM